MSKRGSAEGKWGGHIHFLSYIAFGIHCVGPHKSNGRTHEYMQKTIKGITCYFHERKFMAFLLFFPFLVSDLRKRREKEEKSDSGKFHPLAAFVPVKRENLHLHLRFPPFFLPSHPVKNLPVEELKYFPILSSTLLSAFHLDI